MKNFFRKLFKRDKSNDPIQKLPKNVTDKIFSYLSGPQLLQISIVSKKWYRYIGKSQECMNKVKLYITEHKNGVSYGDILLLILNGRQYKHILINIEGKMLPYHKLLIASFRWKSLAIQNHCFPSKMELINFLGTIEPHVEELSLRTIKFGYKLHEIGPPSFLFPNLHKLTIFNCYSYLYGEIFKKLVTLDELSIATESLPFYRSSETELIERVRYIQALLLNNAGIKFLELFLHQMDFNLLFIDQRFLTRLGHKINLDAFFIGRFERMGGDKKDTEINIVQIHNLLSFLKTQEKSLTHFYMEKWLGNEIFEYIINDLNLQQLTIENLDLSQTKDESIANLTLFSNETIERLSIWTRSMKQISLVSEILKVCRSLRAVELRTINQNILDTMVEFNTELELILVDNFTAYIPPERPVFRKLRKLVIQVHCADNFRDLVDSRGDNYNNFEKIFLDAAKRLQRRWHVNNYSLCNG